MMGGDGLGGVDGHCACCMGKGDLESFFIM